MLKQKYFLTGIFILSAERQPIKLAWRKIVWLLIMAKEKVNYQEVYDLYQLCSETKDLREFCADYGVNYDKFMNWQRHQLWSEKLGKTVQVEQPKVAKVQITGKPCNSPTVKLDVKHPEGEPPIKWIKLQLASGATLFLRNTTVLDLSLLLNKMIG